MLLAYQTVLFDQINMLATKIHLTDFLLIAY